MKRLLTYEFGSIKLYDNYVLAEIHEGITVPKEAGEILRHIADNHYKGRLFAYISHRKYSYSVDPAAIAEASKIKNLIAFAIVTNIPSALQNTRIESMFTQKTYQAFEVISEAKLWANKKVKEHTKKAQNKSKIQSKI